MIPQAGRAYAYAYATLGELVAWIIGWDLILEYAVGNVAVAISWADYFTALLRGIGLVLPPWLTTGYRTALFGKTSFTPLPGQYELDEISNSADRDIPTMARRAEEFIRDGGDRPFLVALCLIGIHAYFGIEVLRRKVILIDEDYFSASKCCAEK